VSRKPHARLSYWIGGTLCALGLTLFLGALASGVVIVFLGFIAYAFLVFPAQFPPLWMLYAAVGVAALSVLLLVAWGERHAPAHTVAAMGAYPIKETEHTEMLPLVRTTAQQFDTPLPTVYIAPTDAPLSLTTGFRPSRARLVISEGLIALLETAEIEAVIAHELAHVKNRDMAVMTIAALPVGAAGRIRDLLSGPTQGVEHGSPSRADYADGLMTTGLLFAFPVAICAHLLWASLSRAREFAADRGAAASTGEPAALASALERIDHRLAEHPTHDFRKTELAAFAIVEPSPPSSTGLFAGVRRAFVTHPQTAERIERLQSLIRAYEKR
jgi:heat shock protein HtpX